MVRAQAILASSYTVLLYTTGREDSQNLALFLRQVTLTNWVKMSNAWRAVKGSVECLGGNNGPKEVSFSLSTAQCLQHY